MKLGGKVAVVTGSGRGIGRAIAIAFAKDGADVVVSADVGSEVEAAAKEIEKLGRRAVPFVFDIIKSEDVGALADKTIEEFGKVDILVNNAGVVGKRNPVFMYDDEIWHSVISVNLTGVYYCTKAFLPKMMELGEGRIINIASISGKQASPANVAYSASKHGVIGITRTTAAELGHLGISGITVNAICPGVANTDMVFGQGKILDEVARLTNSSREDVLEQRIKPMSLQKRLIEPDEIAEMALFLASDSAKGITGQAINVCGGTVFH